MRLLKGPVKYTPLMKKSTTQKKEEEAKESIQQVLSYRVDSSTNYFSTKIFQARIGPGSVAECLEHPLVGHLKQGKLTKKDPLQINI